MRVVTSVLAAVFCVVGGCADAPEDAEADAPFVEVVNDSGESQALAARPPCTAANEGQTIVEYIPRGNGGLAGGIIRPYDIFHLRCTAGAWKAFQRCTPTGACTAWPPL